jgi:hypothetical protein
MLRDAQLDERGQGQAEALRIDFRAIAHDDASALQALQPGMRCCA